MTPEQLAEQTKPRYVDTIYFVGNDSGDFNGTIYRHDDGPWMFEYRFRYSASPDPWDTNDRKSWYAFRGPDASEETLEEFKRGIAASMLPLCEQRDGDRMDVVDMKLWNTDPKFLIELGKRPWAHVKVDNHARRQLEKMGLLEPELR